MEEKKEEKPKVELVQSKEMTPLFTIEICAPVKEQLDKISFCGPNITVKPCNPLMESKCLPDVSELMAEPRGGCPPVWWEPFESKVSPRGCMPVIWYIAYRPQMCFPGIHW